MPQVRRVTCSEQSKYSLNELRKEMPEIVKSFQTIRKRSLTSKLFSHSQHHVLHSQSAAAADYVWFDLLML